MTPIKNQIYSNKGTPEKFPPLILFLDKNSPADQASPGKWEQRESNCSIAEYDLNEGIQSRPRWDAASCSISLHSALFGVPYVEQGINKLLMRESSKFRKSWTLEIEMN